jgi:hypothetical protein
MHRGLEIPEIAEMIAEHIAANQLSGKRKLRSDVTSPHLLEPPRHFSIPLSTSYGEPRIPLFPC